MFYHELTEADRWPESRFLAYYGKDDLSKESMTPARMRMAREHFQHKYVRETLFDPLSTEEQVSDVMPECTIFEAKGYETQDEEEVYQMQFGELFEQLATDKNAGSVLRDDFALEIADMDE